MQQYCTVASPSPILEVPLFCTLWHLNLRVFEAMRCGLELFATALRQKLLAFWKSEARKTETGPRAETRTPTAEQRRDSERDSRDSERERKERGETV